MASVQPPTGEASAISRAVATIADLEDWEHSHPEERAELIRGEIVQKANPDAPHATAQGHLIVLLGHFFERGPRGQGLGGWRLLPEVRIRFGDDVYLPDYAGWRWERMPAPPVERPITVKPDWVCEVLSSNSSRDLVDKLRTYHQAGVGHYWIIDPERMVLTVYRWHADGFLMTLSAEKGNRIRAEPFDAIEWNVACLFGDDDPAPMVVG